MENINVGLCLGRGVGATTQKMEIKVLPVLLFEIKIKLYREAAEQS